MAAVKSMRRIPPRDAADQQSVSCTSRVNMRDRNHTVYHIVRGRSPAFSIHRQTHTWLPQFGLASMSMQCCEKFPTEKGSR